MPERWIRAPGSSLYVAAPGGSRLKVAASAERLKTAPGAGRLSIPDLPSEILPRTITINSITESTFFRYEGRDASDTGGWLARAGYHATEIGSGGEPTYQIDGIGPSELSKRIDVVGGTGKCFQVDDVAGGEITTEDFVIEVVWRVGVTSANGTLIEKRVGGAGPGGWSLVHLSSGELYCQLYPGAVAAFQSAVLSDNTTYHAIGFADRSGSGQWYVNGAASGASFSISAASATLTSAYQARLMGDTGGTSKTMYGGIYMLQVWKRASWLDTHLQAAVASARWALVDPYI